MAKPVQKKQTPANTKAIAAVSLLVALALTIAAVVIGLTGMKLDGQGLYKLLAWIPSPMENSTWKEALVPGADLGATMVQRYEAKPLTEGEAVTPEQLDQTAAILSQRLSFGGWTSAQAAVEEGALVLTLPDDGTHDHAYEMLAGRGEIGFAGPDGEVFLTQDHIKQASYGVNPQDGSYAVSFILDNEGKKLFADKTTELIGQSMSLMVDGTAVSAPRISEPLTMGQASLPGFTGETGVAYASMMHTKPLPVTLSLTSTEVGAPLLGEGAANGLALALYAAAILIALFFVWQYRLSGVIALWLMVIQLVLVFFLAALTRAGYTLSTLLAIYLSFGLLCFSLLVLYRSMKTDLDHGRSIKQAIKEAYGKAGKTAVDVLAALLLIAVVLIIINAPGIGQFMRMLALGLLVDLVLFLLVHRLLLGATVNLFGADSKLYHPRTLKREVA